MQHWQNFYTNWTSAWNFLTPLEIAVIVLIIVWSMTWKGFALWRAARRESKIWFIALLLVNSLGILDILYIYVFGKAPAIKKES